jgi:hypothetical protein
MISRKIALMFAFLIAMCGIAFAGNPTKPEPKQFQVVTAEEVAAYTNQTMKLLYTTKLPVMTFWQSPLAQIIYSLDWANQQYATNAAARSIRITNAVPESELNFNYNTDTPIVLTFATTNMTTLEHLLLVKEVISDLKGVNGSKFEFVYGSNAVVLTRNPKHAAVTNGHFLTDAQVQAYSNKTMTLLFSTKIPIPVEYTQGIALGVFQQVGRWNQEYAISTDASNIVFIVDGGEDSWSLDDFPYSTTCAFTNASVLEILYWLETVPHSSVKMEYTPGKVTLKKKQ